MNDRDIAAAEKEFAAARPADWKKLRRSWQIWLFAAVFGLTEADQLYSAIKSGQMWEVVSSAMVITFSLMLVNESLKISRLHGTASEIIRHYKEKAGGR